MKVNEQELLQMFKRAKTDKEKLYEALSLMGTHWLHSEFKDRWSLENPTFGYCYTISEYVYWYALKSDRSRLMSMITKIPSMPGVTHWFVQYRTGELVDLSAGQFDNYEEIDYSKAIRKAFFPINGGGPSMRARVLAEFMDYKDNDWITESPPSLL